MKNSLWFNHQRQTGRIARGVGLLVLIFAASVRLSAVAQTVPPACDPSPAGLVSWWPGEGNAKDVIGGNNGLLVGGGYTNGEVGQAFVFNGNAQLVTVGNPTNLHLQTFTIEAWIRRTSTAMVSHGTAGNGIVFGYGYGGYGLYLDPSGVPTLSRIGLDQTKPSVAITNTGFHHVAVTKSGSTVVFYVDGLAYAAPAYNPAFVFTTVAAIGARGDNLDNSFIGVIDETSVYNRALASNEIAAIYQAGSGGKCPPTPPLILAQPANQAVNVGNPASFSVSASGTPPLSYQWSLDGTNLAGATNLTLTLTDVQLSQAGTYAVWVSNAYGSATSSNAVLTVNSSSTCDPAPAGIVDWWPAEGTVADIIGTNNGTLEGGLGFAPGEVGQAFCFNALHEAVVIPASQSLNVGAGNGFTLEAWVNCTNVVALNPIFEWNLADGKSQWGVHFYIGAGGPGTLYANVVDSGGGWHSFSSAAGVVAANVFQHAALTYDKTTGTATIYCNGQIVAQANLGRFTPQTSYSLYLGRRPGPDADYTFAGLIDEPSLYNRALATNEIAAIYQAGSAGKCPPNPPLVLSQPTNQVVAAGQTASFSVTAAGTGLDYQWSFNGTNITGANSSSLVIPNVKLSDTGNYQVLVSNPTGSTNSLIATLDISPSITAPFMGATPIWGRSATLSVGAIGNGTLTYQWYFNGQPIAGAANPQLDFASIQLTNSGFYSVVISSPYGSVTNAAYQVAVDPAVLTLGFYPGLTITGSVGNSYLIQRSSNLGNATNWQTVSSLTLYQPVELWIDTSVDASSPLNTIYFYQAIPQ